MCACVACCSRAGGGLRGTWPLPTGAVTTLNQLVLEEILLGFLRGSIIGLLMPQPRGKRYQLHSILYALCLVPILSHTLQTHISFLLLSCTFLLETCACVCVLSSVSPDTLCFARVLVDFTAFAEKASRHHKVFSFTALIHVVLHECVHVCAV